MLFKKANKHDLKKDNKIFKNKKFNQVIDSPEDIRDYTLEKAVHKTIKRKIDTTIEIFPEEYETKNIPVLNQSNVGSCVAHALSSALRAGEITKNFIQNNYSTGYIYGNRKDTDYQGEGMYIREALSQLKDVGDVYKYYFPFNRSYTKIKKLLSKNKDYLDKLAYSNHIEAYYRCYSENEMKKAIMLHGCVIISINIYSDFSRDLKISKTNEIKGSHAMIITGWTKDNKWIVQNSWSIFWGYKGKLLMDFDYKINECWGIIVNNNAELNKKENLIKKIKSKLLIILKTIKYWFIYTFKKK